MNVPQFALGVADLVLTLPVPGAPTVDYGFGVPAGGSRIARVHAMRFTMKSAPSKTLGWQLAFAHGVFGDFGAAPTLGTTYTGKAIDEADDALSTSAEIAQFVATGNQVNGPDGPWGLHTFSYVGETWEVPIPAVARFGPQLIIAPGNWMGFMADPVYGQSGTVDVEVLWSE